MVALSRTFVSLGIRNYRLFYVGQGISLCGTWMQRVAQAWLVLELTDSGLAVGAVAALQFLPMLLVAPFGGLLADRLNKRKLLVFTQTIGSFSALVLGLVTLAGIVELWMVYSLALALGLSASIDSPVRHTFVLEMVGREHLPNAISLHSTLVNAARIVGPAIAGVLIITVGIGWCFIINAFSYLALVGALLVMNRSELIREPGQRRTSGQLRDGLRYARRTPSVSLPLLLMAVAGLFAYEYQVVLPLFARFTFGGDAQTFSWMTAAMGVGAILGGLLTASRIWSRGGALARIAVAFGIVQLAVSVAPTLPVALVLLALLGTASVAFIALGNSTLQLAAQPEMRGRVMGLYLVAFLGSTPVGGPLMGWIAEQANPRVALGAGGAVVVAVGAALVRRMDQIEPPHLPGDDGSVGLSPAKL